MKRWAILTVLLYALALLLLTLPAILAAFGDWGLNTGHVQLNDAVEIYSQWGYWLWLAVLLAGQTLLLLVPIDISERRLPARRKLKVPVIVTAFFLANLFAAGIFSAASTVFLDRTMNVFSFVDRLLGHRSGEDGMSWTLTNFGFLTSAAIIIGFFWIVWGFIFHRYAKADAPDALLKRCVRWLLGGSILELLIALPSHIIVRRRDDCCAPIGTFWGIATGISVMLLCFGPGVYFLFVERMQKLKPKPPGENLKSEQK